MASRDFSVGGTDDYDRVSTDSAIDNLDPSHVGKNVIVSHTPEKPYRLGTFTVVCLIINRTVGTGIFNSPGTVMRNTNSVGLAMIFWFIGGVYTFAGAYLNIELGLSIPTHKINGQVVAVPRSGGLMNYLQWMFPWPAYQVQPNVFSLITSVFSISYLIFANSAGNCLVFGIRVLEAANVEPTKWAVIGIAILAASGATVIHAISRSGGIYLSNIFGTIKILLLAMMIAVGIAAWAGAFHTPTFATSNMGAATSFSSLSDDPSSHVQAFLAVIFAWAGIDQANYVLSEIKEPHKRLPRGTWIGVTLLFVLYMGVNIVYMVVVPAESQVAPGSNVAAEFFRLTFGALSKENPQLPQRLLSAFMAVSSLGNIIVMTFTISRLKQEIAKEGMFISPKVSRIFALSYDISIGRWLGRSRKESSFTSKHFAWLFQMKLFESAKHAQETPLGALFLHWFAMVVLILVTSPLSSKDAYGLLVNIYSYLVIAVFNLMLGIGMLRLLFSTGEHWKRSNKPFPLSMGAALIFMIGSAFPVIASWVPSKNSGSTSYPWFTHPVVSVSTLVAGSVWYLAFLRYAARRRHETGKEFSVERQPQIEDDPPVQFSETVFWRWVPVIHDRGRPSTSQRQSYTSDSHI